MAGIRIPGRVAVSNEKPICGRVASEAPLSHLASGYFLSRFGQPQRRFGGREQRVEQRLLLVGFAVQRGEWL